MKIYIIGPSGAGKSTLSRKLAQKYNTNFYELDKIVYDDDNNHIKRTDKEITKIFNEIINKDSWIIEDVGRSKFIKGRELANIIYYLKIPKIIIYKRVITRWIKQRLGKETYNYPPTIYQFFDMLKTAQYYLKEEKEKIESLQQYKDKVIYLNVKEINKLENKKIS